MLDLLWLVPALPLVGAVVLLAGALRFDHRTTSAIGVGSVGLSLVVALGVLWQHVGGHGGTFVQNLFRWISAGDVSVDFTLRLDALSAVMLFFVTFVGFVIHVYSVGYMHSESARSYARYFAYLNLFMFAMLVLVLGANLAVLFIGWEGVGLCSYLLIGFYFEKDWCASAGKKAFIVNRIGDFGFLLAIFWAFRTFGTIDFAGMQALITADPGKYAAAATPIALLLFVGAVGKSAQLPLYVWLPDAMAGPTPVSALIHAATMVTAGVYMVARSNFIFALSPTALLTVAIVGGLTAVFAASIGLAQNDIKKVLAYSTVSQLGYMFLAMGVGAYAAGIFHLMTHAFFKACLFLGSGSVIHAMGGEQDMRKMGGLKRSMPVTYWTFLIATLAIAGVPGTAGFFSKDGILWSAFSSQHGSAWLWMMGFVGAGMTSFYMFRQVFLTFHGECRADHHTQEHLHESPAVMTYPLIILAALALIGGYVGVPHGLGGVHYFERFLAPVFGGGHGAGEAAAHVDPAEHVLMGLSVLIVLAGFLVARAMYLSKSLSPERLAGVAGGRLYQLLYDKYYVDEIYAATVLAFTLFLTRISAAFDRYVIDYIVDGAATLTRLASRLNGLFDNYVVDGAVNGVARVTIGVGSRFRQLQTGSINGYLYVIAVATLVILLARVM